MSDPLHHLIELSACLAEGRPVPPPVAQWLSAGIQRAARRCERLDEGLGLAGPGKRPLQPRLAYRLRDAHLVAAARGVVLDPQATSWGRAVRLAEAIDQFLAGDWPTSRQLARAPADWPSWKSHLHAAARTDLALPTGADQLRKVLESPRPLWLGADLADHLAHLLTPPCEPSTSTDRSTPTWPTAFASS